MPELSIKDIRKAVKLLKSRSIKRKSFFMPMRGDIRLSVSGVVVIPGFGFMHPKTFEQYAGKKALKYLMRLPRVVTEYD